MAGTFKFELVTPESIMLSMDVEQVLVPGSEGDFTVFEGHAPVITTLRPGVIHVTSSEGIKGIFVHSGFAEVTSESLIVLAERAFMTDEIDPRQLKSDLDAAEKALEEGGDDEALRHIYRAIEELKALRGEAA